MFSKFQLRSLRSRLTFIFLSLAVVPLLLNSIIVAVNSFRALQDNAVNTQREVALRVEAETVAFFQVREHDLSALLKLQGFAAMTTDQQRDVLASLQTQEPDFIELAWLDSSGQEQLRISKSEYAASSDLQSRADQAEFTTFSTQDLSTSTKADIFYFSPIKYTSTNQPFIVISSPAINLQTGKLAGVIVANLSLDPVWTLLENQHFEENNDVYIVTQSGVVVAHQNPSVVLAGSQIKLSGDGQTTGLKGLNVIRGTHEFQLGTESFVVVAEQPAEKALTIAYQSVFTAAVMTLIVLIVAIAILTISLRQIVNPIEALSTIAHKISGGNFGLRAPEQGSVEIKALAVSFNEMTELLSHSIDTLESRVADRTRDLKTSANVSGEITTILDLSTLLPRLVAITQQAFKLYHVGIFIYHKEGNYLQLEAASSGTAQQMLTAKRAFYLNRSPRGLVPQAAQEWQAVLSNDVMNDNHHVPNPLLPDTHAELCLPMRIGSILIGVLDLQATEVGHFSANDVEIFQTLADQIAIAVRNAQLFTEVTNARQEAERANKVKSAFLASMSHELRTPLNAIINFTTFVSDGDLGAVNNDQRDLLGQVLESAHHLLNLINDVLDMSKIEAGTLNLLIEDNVNLHQILQSVYKTGQGLLGEKAVALTLAAPADLPAIRVDRQRIVQVLLNIVSNACKFTKEGSIAIKAEQTHDEILISVKDTGPGISLEDHAKVFEAFKQTETGIRQGGGTGLGMPISKSLVEAHGGRIWLESEVGSGTTFFVTIPVKADALIPVILSGGATTGGTR